MANNNMHSPTSDSSHSVDPVLIQIQQPTPTPPPPQVLGTAPPSRKNTMTKLKTIFGHHPTNKKQSKSNTSSHESSRANSPLQTPISSPDLKPYSNGLLRQPSATNILTQGVTKSNGTSSPAGSIHSVPSNSKEQQASGTQRIVVWEDGHEHHLKSARRQEKLGGMLRDLLGTGKKIKDDAVSAMPDFVQKSDDLSLISGLVNQIQNGEKEVGKIVKHAGGVGLPSGASTPTISTTNSQNLSLLQKYGKCQEIIGKGAYGIVRIAHKYDAASRREMLFAVKEFKRRPQEDEQNFSKRLASEFCISSSLHHPNIIHTLDLMRDARGECCEVMEYCAGGDLYSLILASEGGLEVTEANCFFKQLMRGVVYMHSMGVAHCDLKPENLLLTCNGVLKISDFGNGECFRMAWEKEIHLSSGVCGSRPYIAPEEFRESEFDPRAVDIWATGVIYMAMRTGSYLWQVAVPDEDEFYRKYLQGRKQSSGYEPIENLKKARCRNVIYSILDPIPSRRITGKQIINSEWGRSIQVCDAAERGY